MIHDVCARKSEEEAGPDMCISAGLLPCENDVPEVTGSTARGEGSTYTITDVQFTD